jgi:general secretion pathway protein H
MAVRERGFTLIELVIVLGIAALVLAIALPMLSGTSARAQFKAAAHEIAAALRETRSRAIASGRSTALIVEVREGLYRVDTSAVPHSLPKGVRLVLVTTTQERRSDSTGAIRFFPDGSSTGGSVRLIEDGKRYDVLVDWLTGRVSLDDRAPLPAG